MRPHLHEKEYNHEESVWGFRAEPETIKHMLIQECEGILTAFETRVDPIGAALKKLRKHISIMGHSDNFQSMEIGTFINTDIYRYVMDCMKTEAMFMDDKRAQFGMSQQCCEEALKVPAFVAKLRGHTQPTQQQSQRSRVRGIHPVRCFANFANPRHCGFSSRHPVGGVRLVQHELQHDNESRVHCHGRELVTLLGQWPGGTQAGGYSAKPATECQFSHFLVIDTREHWIRDRS